MIWGVAITLLLLGLLALGVTAALLLRGDGAERWLGYVPRRSGERPGLVFYAASHGELLLLKRLLPRLARLRPDAEAIILVPRPSVLRLARDRLPNYRSHCVTPLSPLAQGRVLRRLAAELFVIVEFARIPLWALAAAAAGRAPGDRERADQPRNLRACRRWPWLFRPLLRGLRADSGADGGRRRTISAARCPGGRRSRSRAR